MLYEVITLLTASGELAGFRSIGLNRLEGRSEDGRSDLVLLKLQDF